MNAPVQLAEIARIAEQLDVLCGDDEICFADMIQAETDIDRIIARIHEQIARDQEMLAGIKDRQSDIAERKARLSARVDASKAAIGKFLRAAMLTKLELPEVTYSVRTGNPSLRIVDAEAVPDDFRRIKSEPDKTAINGAFGEAATLPNWLVRDAATDIITARTK